MKINFGLAIVAAILGVSVFDTQGPRKNSSDEMPNQIFGKLIKGDFKEYPSAPGVMVYSDRLGFQPQKAYYYQTKQRSNGSNGSIVYCFSENNNLPTKVTITKSIASNNGLPVIPFVGLENGGFFEYKSNEWNHKGLKFEILMNTETARQNTRYLLSTNFGKNKGLIPDGDWISTGGIFGILFKNKNNKKNVLVLRGSSLICGQNDDFFEYKSNNEKHQGLTTEILMNTETAGQNTRYLLSTNFGKNKGLIPDGDWISDDGILFKNQDHNSALCLYEQLFTNYTRVDHSKYQLVTSTEKPKYTSTVNMGWYEEDFSQTPTYSRFVYTHGNDLFYSMYSDKNDKLGTVYMTKKEKAAGTKYLYIGQSGVFFTSADNKNYSVSRDFPYKSKSPVHTSNKINVYMNTKNVESDTLYYLSNQHNPSINGDWISKDGLRFNSIELDKEKNTELYLYQNSVFSNDINLFSDLKSIFQNLSGKYPCMFELGFYGGKDLSNNSTRILHINWDKKYFSEPNNLELYKNIDDQNDKFELSLSLLAKKNKSCFYNISSYVAVDGVFISSADILDYKKREWILYRDNRLNGLYGNNKQSVILSKSDITGRLDLSTYITPDFMSVILRMTNK